MKRLVLFVEGDGDVQAVPILVKRLLSEFGLWDSIQLDENPFRIGGVERISGRQEHQQLWVNRLRAALKRCDVAQCLWFSTATRNPGRANRFVRRRLHKHWSSARRKPEQERRFRLGSLLHAASLRPGSLRESNHWRENASPMDDPACNSIRQSGPAILERNPAERRRLSAKQCQTGTRNRSIKSS